MPKQLIIYLMVGASATVIDFTCFGLLINFGLPIIISQWLSALIGSTYNFFWHHYVVFPGHGKAPAYTYIQIIIVSIITILASGPILQILQLIFKSIWISKMALVGITLFSNYAIRKWYIFSPTNRHCDPVPHRSGEVI